MWRKKPRTAETSATLDTPNPAAVAHTRLLECVSERQWEDGLRRGGGRQTRPNPARERKKKKDETFQDPPRREAKHDQLGQRIGRGFTQALFYRQAHLLVGHSTHQLYPPPSSSAWPVQPRLLDVWLGKRPRVGFVGLVGQLRSQDILPPAVGLCMESPIGHLKKTGRVRICASSRGSSVYSVHTRRNQVCKTPE